MTGWLLVLAFLTFVGVVASALAVFVHDMFELWRHE